MIVIKYYSYNEIIDAGFEKYILGGKNTLDAIEDEIDYTLSSLKKSDETIIIAVHLEKLVDNAPCLEVVHAPSEVRDRLVSKFPNGVII